MRIETIDRAMAHSLEFLNRCKALKIRIKEEKLDLYGYGCKETGSVRRASMDLTRILADLRAGE